MSNDNVVKLIQPGSVEDQLTEVLRNGVRALITLPARVARGELRPLRDPNLQVD